MIKKCKTLGIPYILLNFVWIAFFFVAQELPFTRAFFLSSDNVIRNWGMVEWCEAFGGFQDGSPFLYPLWFVRDLLVLHFLSKLLWIFIDKVPHIMLVIALILWIAVETTGVFFLDIQGICFWILGGVLVKNDIKLDSINRCPTLLLTIVYVLLGALDFFTVGMQINMCLHRILIMYGVVYWFAFTKVLLGKNVKQMILQVSVYSFSVYIFHEFILTTLKKVCIKLFPMTATSQLLQYICLPIVVVALCIVISICLKKLLPRIYCVVVGGRC